MFEVTKILIDRNLHLSQHMVGFDWGDDESRPEIRDSDLPEPKLDRTAKSTVQVLVVLSLGKHQSLNNFGRNEV